jgi:diguanylate cyclase (GGDEF)-like protein
VLGVHPNTVRSWTDQGRLRCLRINERGDRRYRVADLRTFLSAADPDGARRDDDGSEPGSGAVDPSASRLLALVAEAARGAGVAGDVRATCVELAHGIRERMGYHSVAFVPTGDDPGEPMVDAEDPAEAAAITFDRAAIELAVRHGRRIITSVRRPAWRARSGGDREPLVRIIVPAGDPSVAWGALVVDDARPRRPSPEELEALQAIAGHVASLARVDALESAVERARRHGDALGRATADLASRLDPELVLSRLADHAARLFGADRVAVYRRSPDGRLTPSALRGISSEYIDVVTNAPPLPLFEVMLATGRATFVTADARTPADAEVWRAAAREGYETVALTPLAAGDEVLGVLSLYHDRRRPWLPDELQALEVLGAQAGVALDHARNFEQMERWTAQLQSIQQLGTRLNGLRSVADIGQAIATELHQLIDYHNVRVYRVDGDDVLPVAWRGEIGEYVGESGDELRVTLGEGITGWVAEHGETVYLPDASNDPRSQTIPGTESDLDESMLLAPMRYEDRTIGVIVLSKLGLDQFSGDERRILEIFATIAAQAMANADATERLHAQSRALAQQVTSQRELLRVTESILSTLDPRDVMEEIADRLGGLVPADNLGIDVYDAEAHVLRPIFARGVHAAEYLSRTLPGDVGVGGWVVAHGEAQLVDDTLADARVAHFGEVGRTPGALIVAPLRARDRITGVLTLERLGPETRFTEHEFELIKLFAAHVSIALHNAEAHHAVEVRAQTDDLTGVKNQGTFHHELAQAVAHGAPFSVLMLDLDQFKAFNDRRGHQAGDALLRSIARALKAAGRDSDEVYRYGGDEFALILPNTDQAGALAVAGKVRRAVNGLPAPGSRGSRVTDVTCSVGIATFPADGPDEDAILLAADRACYVAKRAGGDRAATAAEGLALAGEFLPAGPTPVDVPAASAAA